VLSQWDEDETYTVADWRGTVELGLTLSGYDDWVKEMRDKEADDDDA